MLVPYFMLLLLLGSPPPPISLLLLRADWWVEVQEGTDWMNGNGKNTKKIL